MTIKYSRPPLTSYQRAILDDPARFTITLAGTKTGKTLSHAIWLFQQALHLKLNQNCWWVAPVYYQAEMAYKRFKNQISQKIYSHNDSKLILQLVSGGLITFKTAEKPDNLYGEDVFAIVFDEFTRAREEAFHALRSTLTATRGKMKMIGNVKGRKNWGFKLAMRAKGGEPGYSYHCITANDAVRAGILKAEEIEQ